MQPKQKLELFEFLKKFFYGEKNFPADVFSDVANFIKLFSPLSLLLGQLKCLSLASRFNLVLNLWVLEEHTQVVSLFVN